MIPTMVIEAIEAEDGGRVTVQRNSPDGAVSILWMNDLYLIGWFYVIDGRVAICDVSYALKLDEDGHAIFEYYEEWRG